MRAKPGAKTFSGQRLSDWRLGRSLPAKFDSVLPVLSVLIDEAKTRQGQVDVNLIDMSAWHTAWTRARDALPAAPKADRPPFRGLMPYRPEDAEIFFGRRREAEELARLIAAARGDLRRLVVVFGSAGSGKSSLLAAGLRAESRSVSIRLGAVPIASTMRAVAELGDRPDEPVLLVIDQAEELFTSCPDELVQRGLLDVLERITAAQDRRNLVALMAFRSEYGAAVGAYPLFAQARSLTLGPLSETALREVIVRPLAELGWQIEPALVEVILRDIELSGLGREPSLLRLLSPVLDAVWARRTRQTCTLAAYQALGGIGGQVAANAERAWAGLTAFEQLIAQRMILSLLVIGPESASSDRLPRETLLDESLSPGTADIVIERLLAAGVLAVSPAGVELRGDVVSTIWPRLDEWLSSEREFAPLRRRIEQDARLWAANDRPRDLLYRGIRLRDAVRLHRHDIAWNRTALAFLRESELLRSRRRLLSLLLPVVLVAVLVLLAAGLHQFVG